MSSRNPFVRVSCGKFVVMMMDLLAGITHLRNGTHRRHVCENKSAPWHIVTLAMAIPVWVITYYERASDMPPVRPIRFHQITRTKRSYYTCHFHGKRPNHSPIDIIQKT